MRLPFDSRILKIALAVGALAYAIQCFMTGYTGSGIGMVLLAVAFGLSAARSLRMVMVAFRIQQQKMDKAREILGGINPKHLWPRNRGQYWFLPALEVGLKRDEEKAAVMLNLAAIQSSKRRTKEAKALIVQAKRLDKKGMLKGDIRTIEQMVNNPQQVMRRR